MASTATERYLDSLIVASRLRGVPGGKIGQVTAEVEAHVAESGEDPGDAFGTPREYARTWARNARPASRSERVRNLAGIALCGGGGWFTGVGAIRAVAGEAVWGPHAAVSVVAGVVLLAGGWLTVRKNIVIDPRTGLEPRRLRRAARQGFIIVGAAVLLFVAAAIVLGVTLD